jgi:lipopolysaccharide-binding protein
MLLGPPGLELAIRQELLDYATSIALELLTSHIYSIQIPRLSRDISVPVLGDVHILISNVTCSELELRRQAAKVSIVGEGFQLVVNDVSVGFSFHWAWRYSQMKLSLKGEGGMCIES